MRLSLKCFFTAWIFAWVAAVFLPGLAFVLIEGGEIGSIASDVWAAGDLISPWTKLTLGALLAATLLVVARLFRQRALNLLLSAMAAMASMAATLAFLPTEWSGGFGVGLTGDRFDLAATPVYLTAAAIAGLVFSIVQATCARR